MMLFMQKSRKKKRNKKYIIGVVYRPPKQNEENQIMLYNSIKSVRNRKVVTCGDFNKASQTDQPCKSQKKQETYPRSCLQTSQTK